MSYKKVRFTKDGISTVGIVLETEVLKKRTITELSRMYPYSEVPKMGKLQVSKEFPTWNEAFWYKFPEDEK